MYTFPEPSLEPKDEEAEVCCECTECGNPIYFGEFYYKVRSLKICETCMQLSLEVADEEVD